MVGVTITNRAPLIFVVGVMRSGTSAVTGSMVQMGLETDSDEEEANYFNPKGFFESSALMNVTVEILYLLGGFWYAAPNPPEDLWDTLLAPEFDEMVRGALDSRLPDGPAVWKDPQAAFVLPIWRAAIDRPLGAVLVWRDPVEVALSMSRGVRIDLPLGMAVWAELHRRVLSWIGGLPLYVCRYDKILENPEVFPKTVNRIIALLGIPEFADAEHLQRAADFFEKDLRHQTSLPPDHPYQRLAHDLDPFVETLTSLDGLHSSFDPPRIPPLPAWAEEKLESIRRIVRDARRVKNQGRAGAHSAGSEISLNENTSSESLLSLSNFSSLWPVVARHWEAARLGAHGEPSGAARLVAQGQSGEQLEECDADQGLRVSVVVPVWRPSPKHLQRFLASMVAQTWGGTEVCLSNDESSDASTTVNLGSAALFERIRISPDRTGTSLAEGARVAYVLASGEFVAFGEANDVLRVDAVERMIAAIRRHPEADVLYSDECKSDVTGVVLNPDFKPSWSPELLLSEPYLGRLLVVRKSLLDEVGGLGEHFPDDVGYDIMLRATERARQVVHVPELLYYWSWASVPALQEPSRLPWKHDVVRASLQEALARRNMNGTVTPGPMPCTFHVRWPVPDGSSVRAVVLAHDHASGSKAGVATALRRCVHSLLRSSGEQLADVVIALGGDSDPEVTRAAEWLGSDPRVTVVTAAGPARGGWESIYVAANQAAVGCRSSHLCFFHADSMPEPGWSEALLEQACRSEVGSVGARLVTGEGVIQHSGIGLTASGARWYGGALDGGMPSAIRWAGLVHDCSAVSSACLMTRADCFTSLGGFEVAMGAFSDVDYCRRLAERGLRTVFTPLAEIVHYGVASEGLDPDRHDAEMFRRRWPVADVGEGGVPQPDPFVNPCLDPEDTRLESFKSPEQMGFRLQGNEWVWRPFDP